MWSAGEGDEKQRFLADLRALRDRAALEFDELASRAHYPSDVLKEAENGPTLPTLPVLAAYVRACDGDVPEWEERWRRLGFDSRGDAGLPVRAAGASPAAVAGARAAVSVAAPDAYDPERIRAALRASHGRSDGAGGQAAYGSLSGRATAGPRVPESPASWAGGTNWDETTSWDASRSADATAGWGTDAGWGGGFQPDTGERWDGTVPDQGGVPDRSGVPDLGGVPDRNGLADLGGVADRNGVPDLGGVPGNGNHHASRPDDTASSATTIDTPDVARADAIRRDPFSSAWLRDSELTLPPDTGSGWSDQAEAGLPPDAAGDSWFTPRETADGGEPGWPAADPEPSPAAADTWFTARERADTGLTPPPAERDLASPLEHPDEPIVTGFWTPSAASSVPAAAQRPGPQPPEDYAVPRRSWTAPAEILASGPPGAADRTTPLPAHTVPVPSRTIAGPTAPPGPVVPPSKPRSDRLYPVRLLVVIVVAALIGSILVLLLR
jgi:hypothetical protein